MDLLVGVAGLFGLGWHKGVTHGLVHHPGAGLRDDRCHLGGDSDHLPAPLAFGWEGK